MNRDREDTAWLKERTKNTIPPLSYQCNRALSLSVGAYCIMKYCGLCENRIYTVCLPRYRELISKEKFAALYSRIDHPQFVVPELCSFRLEYLIDGC